MPLIFLLPSNPRSPCCGPETTLCESRIPVVGSAPWPWASPRQIGAGLSPDALSPEPVIPAAHRLVRTEVTRQRPPGAARMLQVETGVHHLAHIGSEGKVASEQGFVISHSACVRSLG